MKKWIIRAVIFLLIVAVFVLVEAGIIDWQPLTILAAAVAAPFKLIWSKFQKEEETIKEQHAAVRARESAYQEELETKIQAHEQKIESLEQTIRQLDTQLASLDQKKSDVKNQVNAMSDEELASEGRDLFG